MPDKAYITPSVLEWARKSARIASDRAAAKVAVTVEKLLEWEAGISHPTIKQAETLAKYYKRPFALLFLSEIPRDFQPLQDFRSIGAAPLSTASLFLIRELQQKQSWISDEFKADGKPPLKFIGKFSLQDNPSDVAHDILSSLNLNPQQYSSTNPIKEWIDKAEANGIFISRTSFIHSRMKLDYEEFQGCAIADHYAPFVFINSHDWDAPLLFTLVHELAHLWIAQTGISNDVEAQVNPSNRLHPVELFCNEVAGSALMPTEMMQSFPPGIFNSVGEIYKNIRKLGVSTFAFLVRSHKLKLISFETYRKLKADADTAFKNFLEREEEKNVLKKANDVKGGPSYYLLQVNRNGRLFTQIVLDAYNGGLLQPTHASHLLNVKVSNFQGLEAQLYK